MLNNSAIRKFLEVGDGKLRLQHQYIFDGGKATSIFIGMHTKYLYICIGGLHP